MADIWIQNRKSQYHAGGASANDTQEFQFNNFVDRGQEAPKAALYFSSRSNVVDGTDQAEAGFGLGLTDGTNQYSISCHSDDGATTTFAKRIASNTSIFCTLTPGSTTINGEVQHDSWRGSGVHAYSTVKYLDPLPGNGIEFGETIFGGGALNAEAGTFTFPTSGTKTISGLLSAGQKPRLIFFIFGGAAFADPPLVANHAMACFGWAFEQDGTYYNGCTSWYDRHNMGTTTEAAVMLNTNRCVQNISQTAVQNDLSVTGIADQEFTVTRHTGSAATTCAFLALDVGNAKMAQAARTTPTSNGVVSVTDTGFQAQARIFTNTRSDASVNAYDGTADAGFFGAGSTTERRYGNNLEAFSFGVHSESGLAINPATTNCKSHKHEAEQDMNNYNGGTAYAGLQRQDTDGGFTETGYDADYLVTQGNARNFLDLMIETRQVNKPWAAHQHNRATSSLRRR